jgi:DNA-binding response OmpR family regulator
MSKIITLQVNKQIITILNSSKKRILIVDDEPDITLTYKSALEGDYEDDSKRFEVYTYNDPLEALLNFKPNFYDLLLIDINLPYMNGFELCEKLLKMDINMRVCFISAGEVNQEAIREIHPSINIGCFIKKPVTVQDLVKRIKAELE